MLEFRLCEPPTKRWAALLLQHGADINIRGKGGGHFELIDEEKDSKVRGTVSVEPITQSNGKVRTLRYYYKHYYPDYSSDREHWGMTPAHVAARNEHLAMLAFLALSGADINAGVDLSDTVAARGLWRAGGQGRTPAHTLANKGNLAGVVLLDLATMGSGDDASAFRLDDPEGLLARANKNGSKDLSLYLGNRTGRALRDTYVSLMYYASNLQEMQQLYAEAEAAGIVIGSEEGSEQSESNNLENSFLYEHANAGHTDIVTWLIDVRGTNVNYTNHKTGTTVLLRSIDSNEETVRALLERGANVDASDLEGMSPLYRVLWNSLVMRKADPKIVKLLLEYGADPLYRNPKYNNTPLDTARTAGLDHLLVPYIADAPEAVDVSARVALLERYAR